MVLTQSRTPLTNSTERTPQEVAQTVRPRRGLPGSRAVVGGLLVAVAAVGIFAAYAGASRGPSARYVVAARTLAPGHRMSSADLRTVTMDLPRNVAARAFRDPAAVIRGVTLGPLEQGELVQSANILPARSGRARSQFSFGLDADRAVDGSLRPGDRVDVLVTYGSGSGSSTQIVLRSAELLAVSAGTNNGLGSSRRQVLTVSLPSREAALPLTNAARAGEVTVVRSTGVPELPKRTTYRPPDLSRHASSSTAATSTGKGG